MDIFYDCPIWTDLNEDPVVSAMPPDPAIFCAVDGPITAGGGALVVVCFVWWANNSLTSLTTEPMAPSPVPANTSNGSPVASPKTSPADPSSFMKLPTLSPVFSP